MTAGLVLSPAGPSSRRTPNWHRCPTGTKPLREIDGIESSRSRNPGEQTMNHVSRESLRAELKFLADLSAPLVYVPSKGGGDKTEHLGNYRTHEVEIHDAREQLPDPHLDREGFMLVPHKSAVDDFYDDAALRATYHAELIELLKRVTGAQRVEVFDDTRRSSSAAKQRERGARDPANIVHNDYTHASGHRRLADFFGNSPEELRQFEQRRLAIVNAWRNIRVPVVDHKQVQCDARTVPAHDLVPA